MYKLLRYAVVFFLFTIVRQNLTFAQASLSFVENKGQWADSIHFKAELPGGRVHIQDGGLAYYFASIQDLQVIADKIEHGDSLGGQTIKLHNYKVHYKGANSSPSYSTAEQKNNYLNYFYGDDSTKWRGNIRLFEKIVQHGVYDGIDVAVYSKLNSLKYDFIIAPGADPGLIQLSFEGVMPEIMANGNLHIVTSVNEIIEQAPYAYQMIGGVEVPVDCHFELTGNLLSFSLPAGYDQQYPLIIDPELVFTTFSGGGDFQNGYFSYCTTYDAEGSLYAAGVPLWGFWPYPPEWPTTPGAFQPEYTSIYGPMVIINKYNAVGSELQYSTYFGGSGPNDLPHAMIVNDANELILAGSTGSFNLPVTTGCFDSVKSGGTDIFVTHFNEAGTALIGSTYIGGNIGNSINGIDMFSTSGLLNQNKTSPIELALDSSGNIWLVCNTSTVDFPITPNAFQTTIGGGNADGVFFGLNPACTQMLYGSFIGGSHTDVAYGIQFNSAGNIVICGGTKSSDFPTTANAYLPTAPGSGDWDGFVAIVNPISGELLSSTYLGTNQDDQATHVQVDMLDNVYVLGRTFGDYPISPGVYSMAGTDLFMHKLTANLSQSVLSTRLGNSQNSTAPFFPTAFLVDDCANTYVTGLSGLYTIPLSNMPLTPDAFQTTPGNFWFGVLRPDFSDLLFGTYYGRVHGNGINGDHTHTGSNRLDPTGILYQSLCVNSSDYPGTSPNSWSEFNQNTVGQDIVSFKFAFNLAGVSSGFELTPGQENAGCAPFTVQFENTSTMAMNYVWDFGDGSPLVNDVANPSHTYLEEGTYTVILYAQNDTACITNDTSSMEITVYNPQIPIISVADTLVCDYVEAIQLMVSVANPTANNQFLWQPIGGVIGSPTDASVYVNPNQFQTYTVTVWDTIPGLCGFQTTDTIVIDYKPRVLELQTSDTLICLGEEVEVVAVGTSGYQYQWSPTSNVLNPNSLITHISPDSNTTYTLTGSYPGCADTTVFLSIAVDAPLAVQFSTQPDSICTGQSVSFSANTDSTTTSVNWIFGDGSGFSDLAINESVQHAYDQAGVMTVRLEAQFRACPDTNYEHNIYVYAPPVVSLGADTSICLDGRPIMLRNLWESPAQIHHYLWNTGDTTEAIKVVNPGVYSLALSTEPLGCTTVDEIVVSKDCYIDIPNAFTPNNDGNNDYFFPRSLLSQSVAHFKMEVFNRWGQLVFLSNKTNGRGWDGRFNGLDQPMGVYLYRIDVAYTNGREEHYEGNVTLVR